MPFVKLNKNEKKYFSKFLTQALDIEEPINSFFIPNRDEEYDQKDNLWKLKMIKLLPYIEKKTVDYNQDRIEENIKKEIERQIETRKLSELIVDEEYQY